MPILNPCPVLTGRNDPRGRKDSSGQKRCHADDETETPGDPNAARLGARVLQEAGAIHEGEEHGWAQDRADPHARERAFDIARLDPPSGVSPEGAVTEVGDALGSIGDTCPECTP
jgi:hypothetical protein